MIIIYCLIVAVVVVVVVFAVEIVSIIVFNETFNARFYESNKKEAILFLCKKENRKLRFFLFRFPPICFDALNGFFCLIFVR